LLPHDINRHANQLIFKGFSGGMCRPETSLYVLHLKREMRSKLLILMDLHTATPSGPTYESTKKHGLWWLGKNKDHYPRQEQETAF
jgi:hypothetical protein